MRSEPSGRRPRPGSLAHQAYLTVTVQPRASRDGISVRAGAPVQVRVTAPPADGAANRAVCLLLARTLGCPPSAVEIVRGASARTKRVRIAGLSPAELVTRLAAAG